MTTRARSQAKWDAKTANYKLAAAQQASHEANLASDHAEASGKPFLHKQAGEAHLEAADAHGQVPGHEMIASQHVQKAAQHAQAAGGEWDETKHPAVAPGAPPARPQANTADT
jgi:hypothetical protein